MAVLPDHVAEHRRIAASLIDDAARLGVAIDIDPLPQPGAAYHVIEHNRLRVALLAFDAAYTLGLDVPPVRELGETGHIDDHDLIDAATAVIAAEPTP